MQFGSIFSASAHFFIDDAASAELEEPLGLAPDLQQQRHHPGVSVPSRLEAAHDALRGRVGLVGHAALGRAARSGGSSEALGDPPSESVLLGEHDGVASLHEPVGGERVPRRPRRRPGDEGGRGRPQLRLVALRPGTGFRTLCLNLAYT